MNCNLLDDFHTPTTGNYLISIAKENDGPFVNQFDFPKIPVVKKQNYSLQFYVLVQCNGYESECSDIPFIDYVSVKVSSQGRTVKESVLDYENIIGHNSWTLQSIELREYGFDTIDVMTIDF